MAKQNVKKVAEAPVKVKKTSSVKVRTLRDARPFLSAYQDIAPLNKLTEAELIAEGYRAPLVKKITEFQKTDAEKEALKAAKFKVKYHTPWAPGAKYEPIGHRIVVKLKQKANFKGETVNKNNPTFHNTKSAEIKPADLHMYLSSLNTKTAEVVSYTYQGRTVSYGQA